MLVKIAYLSQHNQTHLKNDRQLTLTCKQNNAYVFRFMQNVSVTFILRRFYVMGVCLVVYGEELTSGLGTHSKHNITHLIGRQPLAPSRRLYSRKGNHF